MMEMDRLDELYRCGSMLLDVMEREAGAEAERRDAEQAEAQAKIQGLEQELDLLNKQLLKAEVREEELNGQLKEEKERVDMLVDTLEAGLRKVKER